MSSSWTITDPLGALDLADEPRQEPLHPGEVLWLEFMEPLGLSVDDVAAGVGRPVDTVAALLSGETDIDPDLALRLAHTFSVTPRFWMSLQSQYRLELARRSADDIERLPVLHKAAV